MEKAISGPGWATPLYKTDADFDVSFRVVRVYDLPTDSTLTRLDVLLNASRSERGFVDSGDQFNVSFYSSPPGESLLHVPSAGIIDGLSLKTNGAELAGKLRALADAIDENNHPQKNT